MSKSSRQHSSYAIDKLAKQTHESIDTSDAEEITDWSLAERGRFYRPVKKQVTLRLDADLIAWFRSKGGRYQTQINAALREYMERHSKTG